MLETLLQQTIEYSIFIFYFFLEKNSGNLNLNLRRKLQRVLSFDMNVSVEMNVFNWQISTDQPLFHVLRHVKICPDLRKNCQVTIKYPSIPDNFWVKFRPECDKSWLLRS